MDNEKLDYQFERPLILREGDYIRADLEKLKKSKRIWKTSDIYKDQLSELFEINNPNQANNKLKSNNFLKARLSPNPNIKGAWVYFPWNGELVHMLNEKDYYDLRTNRNRELIYKEEQEKLQKFRVGIAGLSIGSNMALMLAHLGIKNFKIADFDTLDTSNLNRVRSGIHEIGKDKASLTAQKLYEINPFTDQEVFGNGLTNEVLDDFLVGDKKLNLVIDAIDDFEIKIRLRMLAKKERIPVVMVTNLGDSCLVDVERYDLNPKTELFNGLLGQLPEEILKSRISEEKKKEFAAKIVGVDHVPGRALETLVKIGKTLVGRPQLAGTVSISAGIATYLVRKIALNTWPSKRLLLHFDSAFLDTKDASKIYDPERGRKNLIKKLHL